jgi:hypothetical protein
LDFGGVNLTLKKPKNLEEQIKECWNIVRFITDTADEPPQTVIKRMVKA